MKAKKHAKPFGNQKNSRIKSRKQIRKEQRKEKKAKRNEYYTNRNKSGRYVLNPDRIGQDKESKESATPPMVSLPKDQQQNVLVKEKREHEKLQKQMAVQRKKQLLKANDAEDVTIRRLEKQLKLNKRKSKSTPKSFAEDGLDYLLEMCNSENMKAAIAAEQQFTEINQDFEEDFALMTSKTLEHDDRDSEMEIEENVSHEMDINEEEDSSKDDDNDSIEGSIENSDQDCAEDADDNVDTETGKDDNTTWEDIYGRLRGKDGEIIQESESKYIPPAVRAKMEAGLAADSKNRAKLDRLRKQLKGLLNRLAESNMHNISSQIEELYMKNSRNDMNDTLASLLLESLVTSVLTPERLLLEHVLLVTILHANIGTEVGAHFLQVAVRKFNEVLKKELPVENKMLDNITWIIAELYNYKVFNSQLMHEILNKLSERFSETDIECTLLVLKNIGFSLRKDDPLALKNLILNLQKQANVVHSEMKDNPRVKFMLDILLAIKNNNMSKIPNYDNSYSEHLKKLLKGFIRKGCYVTTLNISLEDLLKADEYGKWWVVGSAWSGKTTESDQIKTDRQALDGFSKKLLDLARKQRMNTDIRREIFCIIMSAEDYLDAFEKLLHLGLKNQQEREIVHVVLHCCLHEKFFNPYYAVLAQKFCEHDRRFQMTIKCSVWDKLKTLTECSTTQLSNLAKLLAHLFLEKGLPISTLKIVEFSELDKITLRFMRQVLIGVLLCEDDETCQGVFLNVSQSDKLKMFRESLKLFIQHFLLRNLETEAIPEEQKTLLRSRAKTIDKIMSVNDKKVKF